MAVSLSVANGRLSLPVAYKLYLPETWAENKELRRKPGISDDIVFCTKLEIALELLRTAVEEGVPAGSYSVTPDTGTATPSAVASQRWA